MSKKDGIAGAVAVVFAGAFFAIAGVTGLLDGYYTPEPVEVPSEVPSESSTYPLQGGTDEDTTEDTGGDNFIGGIDSEEHDRDRHRWHYSGGGGGNDGYTGERCYAPGGETYRPC